MQSLRQSDKCFCQYQFWCKNVNFVRKKIEILGEILTFPLSGHYYWKWSSFCKICLFLDKCDFLYEGLYTLIKYQILIKNFHFLVFVDLHVLIFIKVFNLLENCYFDPKYHFVQFLCHFPSKIYITLVMNFLEKLSNFLRKVVIYLSILGKNDN